MSLIHFVITSFFFCCSSCWRIESFTLLSGVADGGRMLMLVIKRIVGSRVSLQAERLTYLVGFGFLFAFLIWITYFDIARIGGQ